MIREVRPDQEIENYDYNVWQVTDGKVTRKVFEWNGLFYNKISNQGFNSAEEAFSSEAKQ